MSIQTREDFGFNQSGNLSVTDMNILSVTKLVNYITDFIKKRDTDNEIKEKNKNDILQSINQNLANISYSLNAINEREKKKMLDEEKEKNDEANKKGYVIWHKKQYGYEHGSNCYDNSCGYNKNTNYKNNNYKKIIID